MNNHPIVEGLNAKTGHTTVESCYFTNNAWWDIAFAGSLGYSTAAYNTLNYTFGIELRGSYEKAIGNTIIGNDSLGGQYVDIICNGQNNLIEGNILDGAARTAQTTTGIWIGDHEASLGGASNNTVTCNKLSNFFRDYGYGIHISNGSDVTSTGNFVTENTLNNMKGTSFNAISITSSANNTIENNVISNIAGSGVVVNDPISTGNVVRYNSFNGVTIPETDKASDTVWENNNGALTAAQLTPNVYDWDTAPSSLSNCFDGDWASSTTEGIIALSAGVGRGNFAWSLGVVRTVTFCAKLGVWSNDLSANIDCYLQVSNDRVNFYSVNQSPVASAIGNVEQPLYVPMITLSSMYVRIQFQSSIPIVGHVKLYEVSIIDS